MISSWASYFIGFLGILFVLLYKYSTRKYDYWKRRNVPEIKPIPFLGSFLPVLTMRTTVGEWLWDHYNKINAHYFGIYIFDQPVLVAKSPKLVKALLQRNFDHFEDRSAVTNEDDPIMSELLFFKKNPSWKPVRAKLSPIFTSGKLKMMFPLMMHESEQMTNYLRKSLNHPHIEAKEISAKFSVNLIAKCAFAVDAGSFKNENAEFRCIARQMFGYSFTTALRQFGSFYTPNLVKMFKIQFFQKNVVDSLKRIFKEVLYSRKESDNLRGSDLVDLLIEANKKSGEFFNDNAMIGSAIQFFSAGFETISGTLSWTLYEIAINPEVQERLRVEVQEYFERDNGISYTALSEMKYLDMVVCETLRKYPAIPFLDRMCKVDYKVEGTDLVIEKGTPVYIPMFGLHYDPKYFPEPDTFNPERFSDKSWINNDGMFYIPFGEGPRICIGERFGLLGVKLGLAAILLQFRVEKNDKTPIPIEYETRSLVLQSKVGLPLTFAAL